jgi:hypothetical protein
MNRRTPGVIALLAFALVSAASAQTNLAQGKAIAASSVQQTFVAANANDGSVTTYWEGAPNTYPNTLTVSLGTNANVTSVVLRLDPNTIWATRTQTLAVLGHNTSTSTFSTLVASATYTFNPSTNSNTVTIPVTATVSDVQLSITGNSGATGAQIAELQVMGTTVATPTSTARPTPTATTPPSGCAIGATCEAEAALLGGGVVTSTLHAGFTGTGFADYAGNGTGFVEWTVSVPTAGTYNLSFRYGNGGTTDRPMAIAVNGTTVVSSMSFPSTTTWPNWTVRTQAVSLPAGSVKIRATELPNGPNVDNLVVTSGTATATSTATATATPRATATSTATATTRATATATTRPTPTSTTAPTPTTAPGSNLAVGKSISASSVQQTFVATNANDSSVSSYWEGAANSYPNTLTISLGGNANVTSVVVKLNPDPVWATRTETIQVLGHAQGASTFTSLVAAATYTFNPSTNGNSITIPVTATVSDVRLSFTANSGATAGQVAEFQIFGAMVATTPTATSATTPTATPVPGSGDVVGKITVGYQGWFAAIGDGSPINAWWHWSQDWAQTPSVAQNTIHAWPDTREYTNLYPTNYPNLGNGQPARLFSSFDQSTMNTQVTWMKTYGVDTAALQRFNPTGGEGPVRDAITGKLRSAAEAIGVKFYIMYDVSGWTNMQSEMKNDWTTKMASYTTSPAYARQNGKPVVAIWGFGFNDPNHPWDPATCLDVINWFKSQGVYVIGGVPTYWRTGTNDSRPGYLGVYHAFNMISPWMVGRIGNTTDVDNFYNNVQQQDVADVNANGIQYQPCVLPGDNGQRAHGDFMWRQFYNLVRAGAHGIYISMFDEYNEGNQIAKTAEDASMSPTGTSAIFFTLDQDGTHCSSDYYLRLTGDGGKMLKGQLAVTPTRPTSPQ